MWAAAAAAGLVAAREERWRREGWLRRGGYTFSSFRAGLTVLHLLLFARTVRHRLGGWAHCGGLPRHGLHGQRAGGHQGKRGLAAWPALLGGRLPVLAGPGWKWCVPGAWGLAAAAAPLSVLPIVHAHILLEC